MSRCFPFPPPGYSAKVSTQKTLIESIKLQKEREKAKAERKKERRREKKEKSKEKKEKDKASSAVVFGFDEKKGEDKAKTKKRKRDEENDRKGDEKRKCEEDKAPKQNSERRIDAKEKSKLIDVKANTNELLEKSDLTQEHEQPFFCSQNTYCLSDSSENSNQRRQQAATTLHEAAVNAQGKQLIRIRLPSLKNIQPEVFSTIKDEQPCNTFLRADPETNNGPGVLPRNEEKAREITATYAAPSSSSSFDKKMNKIKLIYKDLVENWEPPSNVKILDTSDFDWFLKKSERCSKPTDNESGGVERSSMWPRAHYLAEADLYLMPYTIPF